MNSPKQRLWLATLLLWIAFLARAHNITALPPFNDESHHIRRAEVVWTFENPDTSLTLGKVLTYYWYGLFGAARLDAIWVTRTATGLFALLGLAASWAIGRRLLGDWAGLGALYLLSFAPFMVFFDRMALTDAFTASIGMVMAWAALLMLRKPQEWEWGVLVGVLAWLTVLAKLTALPFLAIPAWAVLLLTPGGVRQQWGRYRASLLACYLSFAALIAPFVLRVLYKEVTGNRISVVDTHLINTQSPLETILHNLEHWWEANWVFYGPVFWLLSLGLIALGLYLRPRPMAFLLGGATLAWSISLLASGVLSTRYLVLGVPFWVLAVAGAGGIVMAQAGRFGPLLSWGLASLWIAFFAQGFILNAWNDPRQNHYPLRDRWEYFTNFTAGYGLMEAARVLPTLTPAPSTGRVEVLGLLGSCHQMRLYLPEDEMAALECLEFDWLAEDMQAIDAYTQQRARADQPLYMLVEPTLPYVDLERLSVQHRVVGRFGRPFDGMSIELWQVTP